MHGRVMGNEAGGLRGKGGRRCRPVLSLLLAVAFLAAVPPVAGAVDTGREGGLAMRLTELLDGLWRWATGRLYEGCEEITVSGHRFCLPRDRVVIWREGAYAAAVYYYLDPLPEGKDGPYVRFSILDARRVGHAPEGMTVPEFNLRSRVSSLARSEAERKILWERVWRRVENSEDGQIIDVSDLLADEVLDSYPYVQKQNGRIIRYIKCSTQNKQYKYNCFFVSHMPDQNLFVLYHYNGNEKWFEGFLAKALKLEKDFRKLIKL